MSSRGRARLARMASAAGPFIAPARPLARRAALALLLAAGGLGPALGQEAPADLVLRDATVHTLDPARPRARALALRDGRIVGISEGAPDPAWIGPRTEVLALAGATVIPGLWDAHGHLLSLGLARARLDLSGARSFAEVVARARARAARTPRGEWVLGRGWDQNRWPKAELGPSGFPTHGRTCCGPASA